jgi:hypothetical protein
MTPTGSAPVGGPGAWSRRRTWAATPASAPPASGPPTAATPWSRTPRPAASPRCLRPRAPKSCARSSTRRRRFSPQANAATSSPNSPGGPCLRPRACGGSTPSPLHSSGAWRNALRRCPETRLRATAPGSRSSAAQATGREGARPLPPSALLLAEPSSKPLPKPTEQVVRHGAYLRGRARRREENRGASGTGPPRRKCPASLTFLTPQPLTMNQAWPLLPPGISL